MRHKRMTNHFKRETGHRKAMIRNLVVSLVEHGRIRTTVEKAKELRRHVERAVTTGKKQNLHARRTLLTNYPNKKAVESLMNDISPRFKDRNGGYTRILKVGRRPGDAAEMAIIEFVDYQLPKPEVRAEDAAPQAKPTTKTKEQSRTVKKKTKAKKKGQKKAKKVAAKKKTKKKATKKAGKKTTKKAAKKKTTKKKS